MSGMTVCRAHGGRSGQALAARDQQVIARHADLVTAVLRGPAVITPVTNPLEKLQELAGLAEWWMESMRAFVADLTILRYSTDGGEAIRGEVLLFERAMDRVNNILLGIAKLNIDERLVAIEENRRDMIVAAVVAGLTTVGLTDAQMAEARAATATHLRVLAARRPTQIAA